MTDLLAFALAPVFATIGLGWLAGRRGWVDASGTAMLGAFVAQFALPVALFLAIVSAPRAALALELLPSLAYGAALLGGFAAALAFAARARMTPVTAALFTLTAAMPNLGGIGLGLFQSMEGPGAAVSLAVANLVGTLTVMLSCFVRLEMQGGGHWSRALRAALLKPMTVLPTLGFALAFLEVPFPELAGAALRPLAQATGGAGLFLTGVILSRQRLRLGAPEGMGVLVSNLLQPGAALLVCRLLDQPGGVTTRAVIAMAIPSGFVGTILSGIYREGGREAGGVLVATTLASVATLPFWIALATWLAG